MNNIPVLEGFKTDELTMDANQANMKALLLAFPIMTLLITPFIVLHFREFDIEQLKNWIENWGGIRGVMSVLVIMIVGIVVHELIHGIVFAVFSKRGFKSVSFGILWKSLTPFCHCKEALSVRQYMISTMMPAIVLGLVPALIAIVTGSVALLLFGVFFTLAAGGDFLILYLLRNEPSEFLVQDHPEKIGCFVFRPA